MSGEKVTVDSSDHITKSSEELCTSMDGLGAVDEMLLWSSGNWSQSSSVYFSVCFKSNETWQSNDTGYCCRLDPSTAMVWVMSWWLYVNDTRLLWHIRAGSRRPRQRSPQFKSSEWVIKTGIVLETIVSSSVVSRRGIDVDAAHGRCHDDCNWRCKRPARVPRQHETRCWLQPSERRRGHDSRCVCLHQARDGRITSLRLSSLQNALNY